MLRTAFLFAVEALMDIAALALFIGAMLLCAGLWTGILV